MKDFTIEFNLSDSEYMTALRLAVGAVCAVADTDVDSMEDFKVCVTESCLTLKGCGFEKVRIVLTRGDKVSATVSGLGGSPKDGDSDFSLALVSALVSDCVIERDNGVINKLVLTL